MFAPHSLPGVNPGADYDDQANASVTVCVQIESRPGVENVEKIAAVDGIDVLFIGPFDLAKQMNVTRGGEEHEAAIKRILSAAHNAGKKAAIFCMCSPHYPISICSAGITNAITFQALTAMMLAPVPSRALI
jgi:4-hydroxy-2-oxoheptanedioate aldolase